MAKSKKTKNKSSSGKNQKSQTKKQQESERNIKPSGKKKKKIQEGNKNKVHASGDDDFRKFVEQNNARVINEMAEDGNCLFRSLCDQLHSDFGSKHDVVRSEVCVYLEENEDNFKCFIVVEEDDEMDFDLDDHASSYTEYMDRIKQEGEWGGNAELVAAAQLYRRNITIFSAGGVFSIESGHEENVGADLMLSYHENSHYNSVKSTKPISEIETKKSSNKASVNKATRKSSHEEKEKREKRATKENQLNKKEKRDLRRKKRKEKKGVIEPDQENTEIVTKSEKNNSYNELQGEFKVLQI